MVLTNSSHNKTENFNCIHNMDEFQLLVFDNNIMQMMNNRMIQSNFNPNQIN